MRILLLASAFNSLTQRVFTELVDRGHAVAVELASVTEPGGGPAEAVRRHGPDLVVAPMLTSVLPPEAWSAVPCLIVHPGPPGDRGPSSLDRALTDGVREWGVTVLQAEAELDAGPVWASAAFPVPPGVGKSELYRGELADAAVGAVLEAVGRFAAGEGPRRTPARPGTGWRPVLRQEGRRIDWERDPTEAVLRRLRAADSRPGVLDAFCGGAWYLHGGHPEDGLRGRPGELVATRDGAVCRATVDGAVWIPELRARRRPPSWRLPATLALGERLPANVPEVPAPLWSAPEGEGSEGRGGGRTWSDIRYAEDGPAGFLRFGFPGGAMSTGQCRRLLAAYRFACSRPTDVLVLGPERDFFSNGIHLGVIEAAGDPAAESWANIQAIDDLVEAVVTTTDRLVVAALPGNAAAGGVMAALAADEVWCRDGAVLNPHYRLMGLSGSELWTYLLPRRVGAEAARRFTESALPVSARTALAAGLVDRVLPTGPGEFAGEVARLAGRLTRSAQLSARVAEKKALRERDEALRPLGRYRADELTAMRRTFLDPRAPYHALRSDFVRKARPARTPEHLARWTSAGHAASRVSGL
ncbi:MULTISPECIES: hydrogenase maturation protein [unclassified Streptomyces]|uniref:hydrogenase maturation protein n=1 Tax=unclassified Streptomyces TaxID=2593676 RepID=UPI0022B5FEF9|nr:MULTISPECIES: hydrogenase maturation protein [unclassified Streptomyces]MCZ7416873.1 hydrogenase maturation protein [Streptomyces sp. WMMC897]MCZ7433310.1 hydrogenase maturation protein [Streptomyces sp. WMMC1477]